MKQIFRNQMHDNNGHNTFREIALFSSLNSLLRERGERRSVGHVAEDVPKIVQLDCDKVVSGL